MGLLSYFKRQPDAEPPAPAPPTPEPDAVAAARARARRRLLGATVLLGVGVIGFPLLFETQPRPIPVDIPIEIPGKDLESPGARPLVVPMARASAAVVDDGPALPLVVPGTSGAADRAAAAPVETVERGVEPGRDPVPAGQDGARPSVGAAAGSAAARPPVAPASKAVAPAAASPAPPARPPVPAQAPARPADDGDRARALLDGQPAPKPAASAAAAQASAAASRVVVQVGAYTDPAKLAEARRKLESLGYKTYTQVLESEAGKRTRVRIGPFPTRAEADKAAARVKAAGLPVAILAL